MPNRLNQGQRRLVSLIVAPVAALVGVLILVVIAMVIFLAHQQTAEALERQRELARGMIDVRLSELSSMADDYAHWDEALDKLGLHPDPQWADENIGANMDKRYGVDMAFVIDAAGQTSYAMMRQARAGRSADQVIPTGYRDILEERRAAGPDAVASGVAIADGLPALIVVAPIRPYLDGVDTTRNARSVLVFIDLLDEIHLARLSKIYRLPNLRVDDVGAPTDASAIVRTVGGKTDVRLVWDGDDPGGRLLKRILPLLAGLLSAFVAMTFFLLRQAYRTAEDLRIAEDKASRDPLSGLWNRAMLTRDLDRRFAGEAKPFALFYLDLDGFKLVNDTHGHDIGDVVIRETSRRIVEALPEQARTYRLGGDEFAVMLFGAFPTVRLRDDADVVAASVRAPIVIEGLSLCVGVTIGIARAPEDAMSASKIVRMADQALYAGKRAGKGTTMFAEPLPQAARDLVAASGSPEPAFGIRRSKSAHP